MTEHDEPTPFRIDTMIIPPEVDLDLAIERNKIIGAWRKQEITAVAAFESLERLYWSTQQHTNGETNIYLRSTTYEFPVEAGMTDGEDTEIYLKIQDNPEAYPYERIFSE